jgi:ABC-type lipoprotein export system ATPase subunit
LHRLFFDLRKEFGQTFVIVTHNEELANMADKKLTMVDGKIIYGAYCWLPVASCLLPVCGVLNRVDHF